VTECDELIEACAAGDRDALRRLFDLEAPRMLGVATRILRDRALAEDAVQDAFLAVWRGAAQFDRARGSGRGWLYAVLRNSALGLLRRASREVPLAPDRIEDHMEATLATAWSGLDEASALRQCLGRLDAPRRRLVLMSHVLGYTHGEIAGRTGLPLGTCKAMVRRGLAWLRECLR
jgi:RNA polymerase sigma-70 factor (ECF subfamily)